MISDFHLTIYMKYSKIISLHITPGTTPAPTSAASARFLLLILHYPSCTCAKFKKVLYFRQLHNLFVHLLSSQLVKVLVGKRLCSVQSLFRRVYHYLLDQLDQEMVGFGEYLR